MGAPAMALLAENVEDEDEDEDEDEGRPCGVR
jgi:hypothetical protein